MTAFSDKNFNAGDYSKFRPNYPGTFYQQLLDYHRQSTANKLDTLLDVGCGAGEAFLPLVNKFKHVIATDISQVMLEKAQEKYNAAVEANSGSTAEFHVCPAEDFTKVVADGQVEMVLAAQCAHWLDTEKWLTEMSRILKPDGTLAYFGYVDPIFVGNPEANEIYEQIVYEDSNYLGPYWQQPGRGRLRVLFQDINEKLAADDRFYDVEVKTYDPNVDKTPTALRLEKTISVQDYFNYGKTWSSTHKWKMANPNAPAEKDPLALFYNRLNRKFGWTMDTQVTIAWKTVYAFARRVKK